MELTHQTPDSKVPGIIKGMAGVRTYAAKLVLVLLIAYGTVSSQAAWLTPEHSHRGEPEHCCGICHAGHLQLVEPSAVIQVLEPARVEWLQSFEESQHQPDALVVLSQSRAPPSQSL